MKVYGNLFSTCTRKVLLALEEKKTDYQFINIQFDRGEQKEPAHLARHPFGLVPVLEDGDYRLYESGAIIRYLDRQLPGISLVPKNTKSFGKMEQWIGVEQSYFSPHAVKIVKQILIAPLVKKVPDAQIIEKAKSAMQRSLDVADENLKNHPYFAGEEFTLADVSWMPYVAYLHPVGLGNLIDDRKYFAAWWKRVSERPAWIKVMAKQ